MKVEDKSVKDCDVCPCLRWKLESKVDDILNGKEFFGEKYAEVENCEVEIGDGYDFKKQFEKLRRMVRETLGIDSRGEYSMDEAMQVAESLFIRFGPPEKNPLWIIIFEGESEDGVRYYVTYKAFRGKLSFDDSVVILPNWWFK